MALQTPTSLFKNSQLQKIIFKISNYFMVPWKWTELSGSSDPVLPTHIFLKLQCLFKLTGFGFWSPPPIVHKDFLLFSSLNVHDWGFFTYLLYSVMLTWICKSLGPSWYLKLQHGLSFSFVFSSQSFLGNWETHTFLTSCFQIRNFHVRAEAFNNSLVNVPAFLLWKQKKWDKLSPWKWPGRGGGKSGPSD